MRSWCPRGFFFLSLSLSHSLLPSLSLRLPLSSPLSPLPCSGLESTDYASWTSSQTVTPSQSCLLKRCNSTYVHVHMYLPFLTIFEFADIFKLYTIYSDRERDTQYQLVDWSYRSHAAGISHDQCIAMLPASYVRTCVYACMGSDTYLIHVLHVIRPYYVCIIYVML